MDSKFTIPPHLERSDPARLVSDPLVSVVMTTYNHEPYIATAIESVVAQDTTFKIELIIGEDCSTDRTREIVFAYQRRYPEIIRVIYSDRNVGMHQNGVRIQGAARGEFVAWCEGDDFWHRRDKLQLQIDAFRADPTLVCVGAQVQTVSAGGSPVEHIHDTGDRAQAIVGYSDLVTGARLLPTCTAVVRKTALARAVSPDGLCGDRTLLLGDLPMWLELSQLGRIRQLTETLGTYRLSINSATRQRDPLVCLRVAIGALEVRYRALQRYPLPEGPEPTRRTSVHIARKLLFAAARVGDKSLASQQRQRLEQFQVKPTLSDWILLGLAHLPAPRRRLTSAARHLAAQAQKLGLDRRRLAFSASLPDTSAAARRG